MKKFSIEKAMKATGKSREEIIIMMAKVQKARAQGEYRAPGQIGRYQVTGT